MIGNPKRTLVRVAISANATTVTTAQLALVFLDMAPISRASRWAPFGFAISTDWIGLEPHMPWVSSYLYRERKATLGVNCGRIV